MFYKNKKLITVLFLLVLVIAIVFKVKLFKSKTAEVQNNAESGIVLLNKSEVYTVQNESIEDMLDITGDLSASEQTDISSEIDAKVLKVLVSEGQSVKKGDLLALLDTDDLSQAVMQQQAQVSAAQSQLDLNKQKMNTQQSLLKQGFVSQIAYDELVANYKSSLQNYNAQLALLKRSQKQLSNTKIIAPFNGVIYQKNIEPGQFVQKNSKLFALANLKKLEIKSPIPSDKISMVKVNESVSFTVENSATRYVGSVVRINPVSEAGTRSYMAYINVSNDDESLKPGQFVQGGIILNKLNDKHVVDCDAVFSRNGSYVMLIDGNNTVHKKDVKILLKNKSIDKCAIDGINAATKLISNSVLTVKDGDKVSLMNY